MHGSHASALARIILACLLTLAATVAPAAAKPKTAKQPKAQATAATSEFFGINGGGLWSLPADQRAGVMAQLKASGLAMVRMDVSWSGIEPAPPAADGSRSFRWDGVDRQVTELAAAGLRAYPLLAYSTSWSGVASGDMMSRPADPALFAGWAAEVARRYGANGTFWAEHPELEPRPFTVYEVWNEPNAMRFWREQATAPEDYADLYALTRAALKSVDPSARAVTGGLVDRGAETFLRRMFKHRPELKAQVDAISYHPYLYSPSGMVRRIKDLRWTLRSVKAARIPIELTETGWSTTEVSETTRAKWMGDLTRRLQDPALNVTRMVPYASLTSEEDTGNWEQWFGLFNADGTAKPSMRAWATAIGSLSRAQARSSKKRSRAAA